MLSLERYAWVTNGACDAAQIAAMERRAPGPPASHPRRRRGRACVQPLRTHPRRNAHARPAPAAARSVVLNALGFRLRLPTVADFLPAMVDAYDARFGTAAEGRDLRHRDFAVGRVGPYTRPYTHSRTHACVQSHREHTDLIADGCSSEGAGGQRGAQSVVGYTAPPPVCWWCVGDMCACCAVC